MPSNGIESVSRRRASILRAAFALALLSVLSLGWFCPVGAETPPPQAADAQKAPLFSFPPMPDQVLVGQSVTLEVRPVEERPLEYRWCVKHENFDWVVGAWSPSGKFVFTPQSEGIYALQVDVRDGATGQMIVQKWLGQTRVREGLMRRIVVVPRAASIPVGTPTTFWLEPLDSVPIASLEFQLRTATYRSGEPIVWEVKYPWRKWPMPPFPAPDASGKAVALEMDVRDKNEPERVVTQWLGEMYPHRLPRSKANLMRILICDDFGEVFGEEAVRRLANELNLSSSLLLWEFLGKSEKEQRAALAQLNNVRSVESLGFLSSEVRIQMRFCGTFLFDLETRALREIGSPSVVQLDLATFPRYAEAFSLCRGLGEEEMHLAALTFALYEGYEFGTPPEYLLVSSYEPVAHCGAFALQLHRILSALGRRAGFVGFNANAGSGAHLFIEGFVRSGDSILLDPSAGYVYPFGSKELGKPNLPQPIVLPQVRDLGFLNASAKDPNNCTFTSYAGFEPGVIYLRPRSDPSPTP